MASPSYHVFYHALGVTAPLRSRPVVGRQAYGLWTKQCVYIVEFICADSDYALIAYGFANAAKTLVHPDLMAAVGLRRSIMSIVACCTSPLGAASAISASI